jgi:hypothetical protein
LANAFWDVRQAQHCEAIYYALGLESPGEETTSKDGVGT